MVRDQILAACAEIDRLRAEVNSLRKLCIERGAGFDKRCADALADEADVLVRRKIVDTRSPVADALLDYRNPPSSARADRLVALEIENTRLRDTLRLMEKQL